MASVTAPGVMTADEYERLDEVLGFRDELIEGERVLSPNAVFPHAAIIKQLEKVLENQLPHLSSEPLYVARETGWRFHNPASGTDSIPGPDLMVIRDDDARRAIKNRRWFEGVPLLVIEVISPSDRKARRLQKVGLYLDMGVPHVVEVDYKKRLILVHTAETDSVALYQKGDELSVPFRAAVDEIFAVLDC
ncbi:MAG: Uma2 family endonuclease [Acidobacteriaceae bacterium]|nr:Uma2 family endonuclease [Acidobacteriaceae bacterium]